MIEVFGSCLRSTSSHKNSKLGASSFPMDVNDMRELEKRSEKHILFADSSY